VGLSGLKGVLEVAPGVGVDDVDDPAGVLGDAAPPPVSGDPQAAATRELVRAAHQSLEPRKVILGIGGPVDAFAQTLPMKDNKPTAYVCTGTACQPPTHEAATLRGLLK
jgi:hypothetical protein